MNAGVEGEEKTELCLPPPTDCPGQGVMTDLM